MGKDSKDAKDIRDGKERKEGRDRRLIDRALDAALDSVSSIDNSGTLSERMARAAKSSDLLSMVWSLPPAQRLMFHKGVRVDGIDTTDTPGFEGDREDGERFIDISSSEIARFQKLLYANGVKGVRRRRRAWMPPARAASCAMCSARATRWASTTTASANPARRSWHTISCGASDASCRNPDGSPYSIARITRT